MLPIMRSTKAFRQGLRGAVSTDPHTSDTLPKLSAVNTIAISNEIFRCQVERKCFNDLLARPELGLSISSDKCVRQRW